MHHATNVHQQAATASGDLSRANPPPRNAASRHIRGLVLSANPSLSILIRNNPPKLVDQLPGRRLAMACSPSRALAYDGETNPTLAEISSSEEWVASYSDLTMPNPTSSMAILAGGWEVDATIDPALLTQRHVSSDISAYDAPIQQP
jgi:hypothetical protein